MTTTNYLSKNAVARMRGMQEVTITKALAKRWLEWNVSNRNLRESWVKHLMNEMNEDKFDTKNGEMFCRFDRDGILIDGQHRLHALVRSNLDEITVPVWFGLSRDSFTTIDDNIRRSPGDVLHIEGYSNANNLASIVKLTMRILDNTNTKSETNSRVSNGDVLRYVYEYPAIVRSNQFATSSYNASDKLLTTSIIGSLHFILKDHQDKVEYFFNRVGDGENLTKDSIIYVLRKILLKDKIHKTSKMTPKSKHLRVAKALYLFLTDQTRKSIIVNDDTDTVLSFILPLIKTNDG